MKKKVLFVLLVAALCLVGCGTVKANEWNQSKRSGAIGAFTLTAPTDGETVATASPVFTWTAADNAETYTLELYDDEACTHSVFKKPNIAETEYRLRSTLTLRKTYYWTVTAQNGDTSKVAENGGRAFRCQLSKEDAEVEIGVGAPEDYTVNNVGMPMTITADTADTLGTGKPTIRVAYEKNSIGWGVASRIIGASISAGDAIKVTYMQTGGDCTLGIRFLEMDSDLWRAEIAGTGGKGTVQTVVVPYSAFTLRKDESFGDHEIQFDLVHRVDILVESCFDAGAIYIGEITSVNYDDYKTEAIDRIEVGNAAQYALNSGGYAFEYEIAENVFDDKPALHIGYQDDISATGWGVIGKNVGADVVDNVDAIGFDFTFSGYAADYAVRLKESDGDLWIANLPPQTLGQSAFVVIPFSEFSLRQDLSSGDGRVQMTRLDAIEFLIEHCYGAGDAYFGDVRFVRAADYIIPESTVRFDGVYGDNMVLQRGVQNTITGHGEAETAYTLTFDGADYPVTTDAAGRWSATLPECAGGGSYSLILQDAEGGSAKIENVTFGDVYLFAGQSNMLFKLGQSTDEKPDADNANLRIFFQTENRADAPQTSPKNGYWAASTAVTAQNASAIAWFVGNLVQQAADVPVGIVTAAVGDTFIEHWMSADAYDGTRTGASVLYNGMLAPLTGLNVKAFVWYQGENNCGYYAEYADLLEAFVADIRQKFGAANLPTVIVQLPVYKHDYNWAYIREVQAAFCAADENAHLVTTLDKGNLADIHPTEKLYIAERIADLIAQYVYGEDKAADMPTYVGNAVDGSAMTLTFENADGLKLTGTGGFEIAGADGVFYAATPTVENGKLVLTCDDVAAPVYARYAFNNTTFATLFNGKGLPVGSFRTYTDADSVAVSFREDAIDTQFHGGSNKGWQSGVDENGAWYVDYNNDDQQGWGIVRYTLGETLGTLDTLALRFAFENFAPQVSIRLYEVDGDCWQAKIAGRNGEMYLPIADLTLNADGWGNDTFDFGLITHIELLVEQCYGTGTVCISALKTMNAADVPEIDLTLIKSFDGEYRPSDYITQAQNTDSVTLSHDAAALKIELAQVGGWANVFAKVAVTKHEGDAISFNIAANGDSATYNFVVLVDGYKQYTQSFVIKASGVVRLKLSDFAKGYQADVDFAAVQPDHITHMGLSLAAAYGTTTIRLGEIRYAAWVPPQRFVIDDFEDYDASSWGGVHPDNAAHPQLTLNADEKNGGEHGMQLRYVNVGGDTTYTKTLATPLVGSKFSIWLKGAATSTVFLGLYADNVRYKVMLTPSGTPVSAEGQVYTFDLTAFLADTAGNPNVAGKTIDKFEIMIQDWTENPSSSYAYCYIDDIVIIE